MKTAHLIILLTALSCPPSAHAVRIEIRYDYDTAGFFSSHPEAKTALRKVADYFESLLHDSLLPIDNAAHGAGNSWQADFWHPGNGNYVGISNLKVPDDTLIVFAGGRNLGGIAGQGGPGGYSQLSGSPTWVSTAAARGQAGALATPKTDFGPWGGSIAFNTTMTWNFSLTTPVGGTTPFIPIALHELGHLLGIGSAASWAAKISGNNFTGAHAALAYGGHVPVEPDGWHWRDDGQCALPYGHVPGNPANVLSKAYGGFGTPHGLDQIVLMDPSSCSAGPFLKVFTDLDIAALRDIGWQIDPPLSLETSTLNPSASPFTFSWPSTSGFTYRLQRSTTLLPNEWTTLTALQGNGGVLQHVSAAPGTGSAFYRLTTDPPVPPASAVFPPAEPIPATHAAVRAENCRCHPSWGTE